MEEAVLYCQLRLFRKPFTANKLALFLVMTCLSLSARVLADPCWSSLTPPAPSPPSPPSFLPNLSSVRNGCGPPQCAVPSIKASLQRRVCSFDCRRPYCSAAMTALVKIVLSPVVWSKKKQKTCGTVFSVIRFFVPFETLMDLLKYHVTEWDGEKMSWRIEAFVSRCCRDGSEFIKLTQTCDESLNL